jgi:head-tail adaptor
MNIGYLDRRIDIMEPASGRNVYGEVYESTPVKVATVWAALDNKSASGAVIQEQESTINRVTWRVRSSNLTRGVTPKYYIRYGSDRYNILAVQEVGRKAEIHFITERVISE